jgi:hypothetical protein
VKLEIFRIFPDLDYLQFAPKELSPIDIWNHSRGIEEAFGQKVPHLEQPVKVELNREKDGTLGGRVPADFSGFTAGCLLLSLGAVEKLHRFLVPSGILLATEQSDLTIEYKIYICRNEVPALHAEASSGTSLPDGSLFAIDTYAFIPELVKDQDVFRLPMMGDVFVSNRFVDAVEEARLSGFVFQKIWSLETGPVERPGYPHRGPAAIWRKQIVAKTEARRAYLQSIGYPMEELTGKLDLR